MSKKRLFDIPLLEDNIRSKKKIHVSEPENFIKLFCRTKKGSLMEESLPGESSAIIVRENDIEVAEHATSTRPGRRSRFHFDKIYNNSERNEDIFEETLAASINDVFSQRKNIIMFSYGTTGSGKTHTIAGTKREPGILNLTFERVFQMCQQKGSKLTFNSFEIYDERIKDLLQDRPIEFRGETRELEDLYEGNSSFPKNKYDDTVSETIDSMEKAIELIEKAKRNKRIGETLFNKQSSRSHCVYKFSILSSDNFRNSIFIIDLAGAERVNYLNLNNSSTTLRETCSINRSLFYLSRCFVALKENNQVPYRQSKLTRVVFDSFVENTQFVLIVNLNLSHPSFEDNYSVLEFAAVAKGIKPSVLNENTTLIPIKKRNAVKDMSFQFLNNKLEGAKQKKIDHIYVQEFDLDECYRLFKNSLSIKRLENGAPWMAEDMRLRNQWNKEEMLILRDLNREQTRIMREALLKHDEDYFNFSMKNSKNIQKSDEREIEKGSKESLLAKSLSSKYSKASLICEQAEIFPDIISSSHSSFKKEIKITSSKKHTPTGIIEEEELNSRSPETESSKLNFVDQKSEEKPVKTVTDDLQDNELSQRPMSIEQRRKFCKDHSLELARITEEKADEDNSGRKISESPANPFTKKPIRPAKLAVAKKLGKFNSDNISDSENDSKNKSSKNPEASKKGHDRIASKQNPASSKTLITDNISRSKSNPRDASEEKTSQSRNQKGRRQAKKVDISEEPKEESKKLTSRYGRDLSKLKESLESQFSKVAAPVNSRSRKRKVNRN